MTRRPAKACQHDGCGRRPAVTLSAPTGGTDAICERHRDQYERAGWTVLPPGRRPGGDASRTVQLHLRVSLAEQAAIEAAAGDEPVSAWIREVVLRQARRTAASSTETDG